MPSSLVLASASPRRQELLKLFALPFVTMAVDVDESVQVGESASAAAQRLAAAKASVAAARCPGEWVLAADTLVSQAGRIFGKPSGPGEARDVLKSLSGHYHDVDTAVVLRCDYQIFSERVRTRVRFREISHDEIERYLALGEYADKAGSYGIQGYAGLFVQSIEGSYSNVVGLPLAETAGLLRQAGMVWWQGPDHDVNA